MIVGTGKVLSRSGSAVESGSEELVSGGKVIALGCASKRMEEPTRSSKDHRREPRVKLYVPTEGSFPIPLLYIDGTRTIDTTLDVMSEKHFEDYWNVR